MLKDFIRGPYALSALLGAAIVVALLIIGMEIDWGRSVTPAAEMKRMAPATVVDAGLLPPYPLSPIEQGFPESAARPIFFPSRRPAPVSNSQLSSWVPGQFLLQGTSITKDFGDIAILKEIATNRTFVVRKGEQIKGATVDKVEPHRVVLKQGEESEEVGIKTQGSPKGQAPAPAQPAAIFPTTPPQPAALGATRPPSGVAPPLPPPMTPPTGKATATSQPAGGQTPQNETTAPPQFTPEEILARRRAARNKQAQ